MKDHSPSEELKKLLSLDKIKSLLVVIPAFLVFLSYIYLFIYYSFFDIDIFSYISINSVITLAIENIGIVFLVTAFGYTVFLIYDYAIDVTLNFVIYLYKKFNITVHLGKILMGIVGIIFVTALNIYLIKYANTTISIVIGLVFIFATIFLALNDKSEKNYNLTNPKVALILLSLVIIIMTSYKAYINAYNLINDSEYTYVMGSDLKGNYPDEKLKLIGKSDDHYFLKYPDKDPIIVKKYDDFERLHIHTFRDTTNSK